MFHEHDIIIYPTSSFTLLPRNGVVGQNGDNLMTIWFGFLLLLLCFSGKQTTRDPREPEGTFRRLTVLLLLILLFLFLMFVSVVCEEDDGNDSGRNHILNQSSLAPVVWPPRERARAQAPRKIGLWK